MDSSGSVGTWNSTAVDSQDRVHISYFDNTNGDLKYAKQCLAPDSDCDDILDYEDNCPENFNPSQVDTDADSIGDVCDNCPLHPNSPEIGICTWAYTGTTCLSDEECGYAGFCSIDQADNIDCDLQDKF